VTRTIPGALGTHYAGSAMTLAVLWKITRQDAAVYGFTTHDQPIVFGGLTYQPSSAFDPSAIATKSEFNVDDMEVIGLLDSSGITVADIEAGRWDRAWIEVRRVNWASLGDGAEILRVGEIGNINRRGAGQFVAELRGLMQRLQNNIGRLISPLCDAEVGDARCGVNMASFTHTTTITTATSRRVFTASGLAQAAGYFNGGKITFTSGGNNGVTADIKAHTTGGVLTLQLDLPAATANGDAFTIYAGCDKRHVVTAGVASGDCGTKFSNIVNFRGFWAVPGRDKTMLVGGQR
jgi:uncharacterized phage protein (TIGR02218 family)